MMRKFFSCSIITGFLLVMVSMLAIFAGAKAPEGDFDFVDDCSDITKYWSAPAPANSENLFIIGPGQKVGEEGVPDGQYRFVGKKASTTYTRIYKEFPTGYGSWTIEFSARFASLPTVDSLSLAGWRGFVIALWRSNGSNPATSYVIGFNQGIIGVVGSSEGFVEVGPSIVGSEKEFHTWKIVFVAKGEDSTMTFFKDGKQVAQFTKVKGQSINVVTEGRLNLQNVPLNLDPYGGDLDVYLDYIAFKKEK